MGTILSPRQNKVTGLCPQDEYTTYILMKTVSTRSPVNASNGSWVLLDTISCYYKSLNSACSLATQNNATWLSLLLDPERTSMQNQCQIIHYGKKTSISISHAAFIIESKISINDQSALCITNTSNTRITKCVEIIKVTHTFFLKEKILGSLQ